jgi:hypothetical protein
MEIRKSRTSPLLPKGGSQATRKKSRSKIKTKAKTATRRISKSQQKVAMEKATAPAEGPALTKDIDEAVRSSMQDVKNNAKRAVGTA